MSSIAFFFLFFFFPESEALATLASLKVVTMVVSKTGTGVCCVLELSKASILSLARDRASPISSCFLGPPI